MGNQRLEITLQPTLKIRQQRIDFGKGYRASERKKGGSR